MMLLDHNYLCFTIDAFDLKQSQMPRRCQELGTKMSESVPSLLGRRDLI